MSSTSDIDEEEARDRELTEMVATEIETTLKSLHRAVIGQNRFEEAQYLSASLRDQVTAYRELREIEAT